MASKARTFLGGVRKAQRSIAAPGMQKPPKKPVAKAKSLKTNY